MGSQYTQLVADYRAYKDISTKWVEEIRQESARRISQLEADLEKMRPRTEHGELRCGACDIISMAYISETKDATKYQCEHCGAHDSVIKVSYEKSTTIAGK